VANGHEIVLPVVREDALGKPVKAGNVLSGVLLGATAYEFGPVEIQDPTPTAAQPEAGKSGWLHWLPVFGGMFLGGLILNLMPCVFPVIGLKVMGFVQQSGGDRRKVVLHGWVFTAGVWASFAVLAGGLWLLRGEGGGQAPAWGYQLQDPRVVYGLMLLMWLLGLNMAGLFEVGVSATSVGGSLQQQHGVMGTFFSGVLATVVATPCSAPYLGSAMAVAVTLPALGYFLAFAAMATGLALPYLVLSAFPKLVESLPRPGPWMERFKQGMSFLLFATAGYLLWVYAGQIGLDALLAPLFGLVLVALACWIYGNWHLPHLANRTRWLAMLFALSFGLGGVWLGFPAPAKPTPEQLETELQWREWSQEAVDRELAAGNPVYVDFTARWCATCQVNKQRAYPAEVVRLMREKGVVAFRADKTRPNPEIDAALERLGRVAIPVNTLQAPQKPVQILPELLSADDVANALRDLPTRPAEETPSTSAPE
jgi:thiol:disulfide interchange protein DsbD